MSTGTEVAVSEARARQQRIRGGLVTAAGEYAAAVLAEDWRVLGFASVAEWAADTLGEQAWQPGPRQQVAELLSAGGMSVRAIAAATGTSKSTAERDVSRNGTPPDQGKSARGQDAETQKEAQRNAAAAKRAAHERDVFERGRLAGLEERPARDQEQPQDAAARVAELETLIREHHEAGAAHARELCEAAGVEVSPQWFGRLLEAVAAGAAASASKARARPLAEKVRELIAGYSNVPAELRELIEEVLS